MLTASQIKLPATDRDVMAREGILTALKKWEGYAHFGNTPSFRQEAADRVALLKRELGVIERKILKRQKGGRK